MDRTLEDRLNDLEADVEEERKERARQKKEADQAHSPVTPKNSSRRKAPSRRRTVARVDFFVLIGAGAETEDTFQSRWSNLLRDQGKVFKDAMVKATLRHITRSPLPPPGARRPRGLPALGFGHQERDQVHVLGAQVPDEVRRMLTPRDPRPTSGCTGAKVVPRCT